MTDHIRVKHKIKELSTLSEFETVICAAMLTPTEQKIVRKHYVDKKPLYVIAAELDYAESTIRLKHSQALEKISRII